MGAVLTSNPRANNPAAFLMILLCIFLFGFLAVVSQSMLIREMVVVVGGNELCRGIVLGAWLAAVAAGGLTGASIVDKTRRPGILLVISAIGLAIGLPAAVSMIRIGRIIAATPPGAYVSFWGAVLISVLGTVPAAFFVGFSFPAACRVVAEKMGRAVHAVGAVYVAEGLGSVAGGMIFSFLLVGRVSAFFTAVFCGALIMALVGAVMFKRLRVPAVLCIVLAFLWAASFAAGLPGRLDKITTNARWRAANPVFELLDTRESVYQSISVAEWEGQYSFFGNGNFILAFPDEYESARVAHLVMAEHPDPREVLVIGGGIEGMVGDILAHPVDRVDYVQMDPALTGMIEKYINMVPGYGAWLDDNRLNVHHGGGRAFVNTTERKYDLVFLNVPDPASAMLNRYYTEEFYREVKGILAPGGVAAARISAPSSSRIGEEVGGYSGSVYAALKNVFAHCVVTPGEVNYFFASDSPGAVSSDPHVLAERYVSRGVSSDRFAPEVYSQIFLPDWVTQIEESLDKMGGRVNTDMNPVTYFYGLVLWGRYSGSAVSSLLLRIKNSNVLYVVLAALWCVLALTAVTYVRRRDRDAGLRTSALISVGSTGLAAMAAELVIMLAFQSFRGYVYQKVGILIGVFMGGLAGGGMLATWYVGKHAGNGRGGSVVSPLIISDAAVAVVVLLLPFVLRGLASAAGPSWRLDMPFYGLAALVGFVTGVQFPLANRMFRNTTVGRSSGFLEWADHCGGMTGAVLAAVLLIPLIGIQSTCLAIVSLKLISLGVGSDLAKSLNSND